MRKRGLAAVCLALVLVGCSLPESGWEESDFAASEQMDITVSLAAPRPVTVQTELLVFEIENGSDEAFSFAPSETVLERRVNGVWRKAPDTEAPRTEEGALLAPEGNGRLTVPVMEWFVPLRPGDYRVVVRFMGMSRSGRAAAAFTVKDAAESQ